LLLVNKVDPASESNLNAALDELWSRFLPLLLERVSTLEGAAAAFANRKLTTEQQEAAFSAAHNLAGVLGTFNLHRGTVLAREVEMLFGFARRHNRQLAQRLSSHAAELRAIVESRRAG
jgi:HPt (histidine-containing phosphotransfer) domain-containing protein